jgi:hypothetical protein
VITVQAPGGSRLSLKAHSSPTVGIDFAITSDSSQSIVFVGSVDVAEHHLLSYFRSAEQIHDLRLRIPEAVFDSEPVHNILLTASQQRRRFIYDRETSVLRVHAMARPVHDAVSLLVTHFLLTASMHRLWQHLCATGS